MDSRKRTLESTEPSTGGSSTKIRRTNTTYSFCGEEGCGKWCVKAGLCLKCWHTRADRLQFSEAQVVITCGLTGDPIMPVGVRNLNAGKSVSHFLEMPYWQMAVSNASHGVADALPNSTCGYHYRPGVFAAPTRVFHRINHELVMRAEGADPIGLWGDNVLAFFGPYEEASIEEKPCARVDEIPTPPTPPFMR